MQRTVLFVLLLGFLSLGAWAQSPLTVGIDQGTRANWDPVVTQFQSETAVKVSLLPYPQSQLAQQVALQARSGKMNLAMISQAWGESVLPYLANLANYERTLLDAGVSLAYLGGYPVGVTIPFSPGWFLAVLSWPPDPQTAVSFLVAAGKAAAGPAKATPSTSPEATIASFRTTKVDRSKHNPKLDGSLEALLGAVQASLGTVAANVLSMLPPAAQQALSGLASVHGVPFSSSTATVTVVLEPQGGRTSQANVAALSALGVSQSAIETSPSLIKVSVSLSQLATIVAQVGGIVFIRPPYVPYPLGVTGQGIAAIGADAFHAAGITGSGVKIAVIDLGFSGLSQAQARGDLPYSVQQNDLTGTGLTTGITHGTAVAEIVHEIAPDAQLFLVKIADEVELDQAITYCLNNGIDVINHSLGWYNTNFYDGTGTIADIARRAIAGGSLWVNAAGNEAQSHWEGTFTDANSDQWNDQSLTFSATAGSQVVLYMTWNDWPRASSDYDLYLYDLSSNLVASSTKNQTGMEEPTEAVFVTATSTGTYTVRIKGSGSKKISVYNLYQGLSPAVAASSILAPADVTEVVAVGAIDYAHYASGPQEPYSSQGPTHDGRPKPDLCAPDNVSTGTSPYTTFAGTSGAAPHAAGAAALLLAQEPTLSESSLRARLLSQTVAMGSPNLYGHGRLVLVPPAPPNQPPTASFAYSPGSPILGAAVAFDASGSMDPDGAIVSYAWDFGDGASASGKTTSHAYATAGTYTVRLVVTDDDGATGTTTRSVVVTPPTPANQPPTASFVYSPGSPIAGATVAFDASGSMDPDGAIVSYAWDFGDGGTASGAAVTHAYAFTGTYPVRLAVTDNDGLTDTTTRSIGVGEAAKADLVIAGITHSPANPAIGQAVNFAVTVRNQGAAPAGAFRVLVSGTSASTQGTVASLGPGASTTLALALALSQSPETFTARADDLDQVVESDETNNTGTDVVSAPAPAAPVAEAGGPYSGTVGQSITFNGSGSTGAITSYLWAFGDGQSGQGATVTHAYGAPGTYTATLTVIGQSGQQSMDNAQVTVTQAGAALSIRLSLPKGSFQVGESIAIGYTTNREAYVYLCEADASGKVTLLFPNYLEQNNRVPAGAHSLPGAGYTLRVSEPAGSDTLYAFAATAPLSIFPTNLGRTFPVLGTNPALFRAAVRQAMQAQVPSGDWAEDTLTFTITSAAPATGVLVVTSSPQGASLTVDGLPMGVTPTQVSLSAGTHTVALSLPGYQTATRQVTITAGRTTSVSVLLTPLPSNQPPTPAFTFSPPNPAVGQPVSFNAAGSYDPDGGIVSYAWDFGDGTSGFGAQAAHAYAGATTYLVRLTVTDNGGASRSTTKPVPVAATVPVPPPSGGGVPPMGGTAGIFVWGTDTWHVTVNAASTWTSAHSYRLELRTDGSFQGVNQSTTAGVAPLGVLPTPRDGGKTLLFEGSLSSGSVDYTFTAAGSTSLWMSLKLDTDGNGTLEQSRNFVYLRGLMVRPPTVPFVVGLPEGTSGSLVPSINFRIGQAVLHMSRVPIVFWTTDISTLERLR
jgi:PKD repeat protein